MKKVFFVFLALVAFASCKKDDLPNSPSSGEKEVVRLSLSGDLGEAQRSDPYAEGTGRKG